jgi:thymidylate kinase
MLNSGGEALIKGVIIEGLPTVGKTSLLKAIKRLHSDSTNVARTMIAISEHYLQILYSDHGILRTLEQNEHIRLLSYHVDYLEHLHNWISPLGHTKETHGIFYIFERFHLGHRAAFTDNKEMEILEQRLINLNAQCVLLTLSADIVESRYVKSRGEEWKSFVMQYHSATSEEETCIRFLESQEKLRNCARESRIPTLEINTDIVDWDFYAKRILETLS